MGLRSNGNDVRRVESMPAQTSEAPTSELPLEPTSEVSGEQPEEQEEDVDNSREFIADTTVYKA